jgi:transposase
MIDGHSLKRHQGASIGEYILLVTINRALGPASKCKLSGRYKGTILQRLLPMGEAALRSQRFWDHMSYLDDAPLAQIENSITRHVVEDLNLDLRALFYDTTNFDPFVASDNPLRLARRGHAKSKRTDLRIVGLALLVSWDFHVPLFPKVYEGNLNDSVTFSRVLDDLVARYPMFEEKCQNITLVFDKGSHSEDNIRALDGSPYHFIGSLVPTQHKDPLKIPLERFRSLKAPLFVGIRVHSTEKHVFGQKRTIVITRSRALLQGQERGIRQHLAKKLRALCDLQKRIARSHDPGWKGKPYTEESIQKNLDATASGQYIADILRAAVTHKSGCLGIEFEVDEQAYETLKQPVLGKRILFTDRQDLTDEDIIFGYRGQHHVERAFQDMKDHYFICFSPAHHWTDHMLRVHAFYCVLALTIVSLLHRRVYNAGIKISQTRLMEQLKGIKEIANYYPAESAQNACVGGRPRSERTLTRLNREQDGLFRALDLGRFTAS